MRGPAFSDHYEGSLRPLRAPFERIPRAEALESSVRMMLIVVPPKRVDLCCASSSDANQCTFKHSSRNRPLKDSIVALSSACRGG